MKYVAFLRGINVGGDTKVSMETLKKAMEKRGFTNIQTVLNSGNVVFEMDKAEEDSKKILEALVEKTFGFHSDVVVRLGENIQKLSRENPFQHVVVTPETRLYVTFRSHDTKEKTTNIPVMEKDFKILRETPEEICWFVILSPGKGTTEGMKYIEKKYGKFVTTRNWNTILKIAQLIS